MLYRQKLKPYTLVTILGDSILYRDGIINLETGLVNFNILLLGQDKAVLGII
jgi:hypothetical protein